MEMAETAEIADMAETAEIDYYSLFIVAGCLRHNQTGWFRARQGGVTRARQVPLCNQATSLLQPTC